MASEREPYAPKIVLCTPLTKSEALASFVEDCLRNKVVLVAVVGDGCEHIEDLIDELVIGDGSDPTRFIVTSSHPKESIGEVLSFAAAWVCEDGRDGVQKIVL